MPDLKGNKRPLYNLIKKRCRLPRKFVLIKNLYINQQMTTNAVSTEIKEYYVFKEKTQ